MADQPTDLLIPMLQELRKEMREGFTELRQGFADLQQQVGILAQGQVAIRNELRAVTQAVHEIAMAVDAHTVRLDRIEKHLGLDAKKH